MVASSDILFTTSCTLAIIITSAYTIPACPSNIRTFYMCRYVCIYPLTGILPNLRGMVGFLRHGHINDMYIGTISIGKSISNLECI